MLLNFQAEADGVDPDQVIGRLLEAVSPSVGTLPRRRRGHRRSRAGRAPGRRGTAHRPASQSVPRVQRGVQPASSVPRRATISSTSTGSCSARTDRLYSRQFRETTNMAVMLALDASASMSFPEHGVPSGATRDGRGRAGAPRQHAGRRRRIDDDARRGADATCRRAAGVRTCAACWRSSARLRAGGNVAAGPSDRARGRAALAARRHPGDLGFLRRRGGRRAASCGERRGAGTTSACCRSCRPRKWRSPITEMSKCSISNPTAAGSWTATSVAIGLSRGDGRVSRALPPRGAS